MLQTEARAEYKGRLMTLEQIERYRKYNREKMRARRAAPAAPPATESLGMCQFCGHEPAAQEVERLQISRSGEFRQVKRKWCGRC